MKNTHRTVQFHKKFLIVENSFTETFFEEPKMVVLYGITVNTLWNLYF